MKFIFPQNYDFSSKIFGIIEYSSAIFDLVWGVIVYGIINLLFTSLNIKIFLFIVLVFPVFIFSVVGINGENILYVMQYFIKYIIKQKVFLYDK